MERSFYENGLRFQCTRCSSCCRLTPGYVFLTDRDVRNLSCATSLSREQVLSLYCREVNNSGIPSISLKEKDNFDCIFWESYGCHVYRYRPLQCRSYPFWSSNLSSVFAWKQLGLSCPGIGKGKLHSRFKVNYWLRKLAAANFLDSL